MTQKAAPKAPKAPTAPTAPAKKAEPKVAEPTAQEFWEHIKEIRGKVTKEGFGKTAGGRDFKDTKALKHFVKPLFDDVGIHYYISPKEVSLLTTQHINPKSGVLNSHYIVHGTYDIQWFLRGEVVFETTAYGSTNIDSASMATQGSLTNATTSALYTILQAETQSDEEYQAKLNQLENTQYSREPVMSLSDNRRPY